MCRQPGTAWALTIPRRMGWGQGRDPKGSGSCYVSQGEGLNLGISKEEVQVHIGDGKCLVKTLTLTHLYCEPPQQAPQPTNGSGTLPQFVVSVRPWWMGCMLQAHAQEPYSPRCRWAMCAWL